MELRPEKVHEVLRRSMLLEGYPFVLDLEGSHGQYLRDAITGRDYLDLFTFYSSRPVRFDHPSLLEPSYLARVQHAARCKPSNGDVYTTLLAEFVETFRTLALGPGMKHLFFIDGGALAVENALKAAFDWKVQRNLARGRPERGSQVIHLEHAFHGRSGYTLSLTNTDPRKTRHYPKFDWPRVSSPAITVPLGPKNLALVEEAEARMLGEIDRIYDRVGEEDIACIIIEPIQCEGGDRYFRRELFQALRKICDERDTLLIFDEVQTGTGTTGTMWYYEQLGVEPDLVAFAKKAQTGGVMASGRLDEVDSVFHAKSRISSTFGGNLVDFTRSARYLEIIRDEHLLENARSVGTQLLGGLAALERAHEEVTCARGVGCLLAFDLPDADLRDQIVLGAREQGLLVLPCGPRSVRLRPALDLGGKEAAAAIELLGRAVAYAIEHRRGSSNS